MVTETKTIELVIVADHSEVSLLAPAGPPLTPTCPAASPAHFSGPQVQRYPDSQHLLNRMLRVTLLLDTVSAGRGSALAALRPQGRLS